MATDQASNIKSVDASLWWDSFTFLLTELENVSLSSDLPPSLKKKLKDNHAWFLDTVSLFKPPNQKSREALDSRQLNIGSHQLTIQPEWKETALEISSTLCLDEVQSYVLVKRSIEQNTSAVNPIVNELLHLVMLQYYIERQCLLKCTWQILMHALYVGTSSKESHYMKEEAEKLISDGLEDRLLSVFQTLLYCSYPECMDVDLFILWAEETLIEDNLVLDIIFLTYYESFCTCSGKQWKKLCLLYEGIILGSCNFGKLTISTEAVRSICHAKIQLLLILIETLDLENLLQMIHDEIPFRKGSISFSSTDIQAIDAIISSFNDFDTKEAGPLILSWAVFLCLISSLPERDENSVLMDIDHVGYVHQAFEAASLNYFLEILQSNVLKDSYGPFAGYRSVLRTFISTFIASYEICFQLEDNNLQLMLDILCRIYRGEESLCIQFWDRDSFVDGPIRCLLCSLEGEFPLRTLELGRLLSALCEGTWPAECVYNFLDKSVGLSSLFEINSDSMVDNASHTVETCLPVRVPGVEGLLIPSKTRGHILRLIDGNTALVRWEHSQSGVLVLLLRLAQGLYTNGTEEVIVIFDLLCRLVTFNTAVCYALIGVGNSLHDEAYEMNGHIDKYLRVDVVDIICTVVKDLSLNSDSAILMSMGVMMLAKMLKCSPCHVSTMALKANIFDVAQRKNPFDVNSNGLSRLAKMLLIDCEQNDSCCPLTISVLDFTMQLVETGVQNDVVLALVIFSVQYILVNHEYWKYKVKHVRWDVTLKVLEVLKKCISSIPYSRKQGEVVQNILLCDSSIHSALFRIVCTTTQTIEQLHVNRLYDVMEIEGLQLAICSVLDILFSMLSYLLKENLPSLSVFFLSMLSSTTKPVPVLTAVISLTSCFQNPMIQLGAARLLSVLFGVADHSQPYVLGNAYSGLDDKEIVDFRNSVVRILREQSPWNEDLVVATFKFLTSAAHYQPAFIAAIIAAKENRSTQLSNENGVKQPNQAIIGPLGSSGTSLLDAILQYVERSDDLIKSNPKVLLNVLNFLKALWQGAAQFTNLLEQLKNSDNFWRHLCNCVSLVAGVQDSLSETRTEMEVLDAAYRYQCQSHVLQIMAYEMFLNKKNFHAELLAKQTSESSKDGEGKADSSEKKKDASGLGDIFSTWCRGQELIGLIKTYASCGYNNGTFLRAKIAAALFVVHVMRKLTSGQTGSLSVSLIEKIDILSKKFCNLPAFSELLSQYTQLGYSEGRELNSLILSDLYYHLQEELEGRKIDRGPFKELSQYLLESNLLQMYLQKFDEDLLAHSKDVYLFDSVRLEADMGLDAWKFSEWKESKTVGDTMLLNLQDVNSMVLLTSSKLAALKALITILPVSEQVLSEKSKIGGKISEQLIVSCVDHICQSLHVTLESLASVPDASQDILDFLGAQVELLPLLIRSLQRGISLPSCMPILKTSAFGLKVLSDFRLSVAGVKSTMKLLLMLLLSSIELSCMNSESVGYNGTESVEAFAEVSNVSLGLLPILCSCIEPADYCSLALTAIDLIMTSLMPMTWFPIIHEHLPLQHVVQKLQDKSSASTPVILKFFLNLARVRGGAEMLFNAGIFTSLRVVFADLSDGMPFLVIQSERRQLNLSQKFEKTLQIWGLGLAVVTAVLQFLGSNCTDTVDYVMAYFLLERAYLISYYLSAPDFISDVHDKKRAHSQKTQTSLSTLKGTEHTLMLICVLAKHQSSWVRVMKEMDSCIRERSIHLLAFISHGTHCLGESPSMVAPLLCRPVLKEEFEWCKKPSFINSRNGWFVLAPLGNGLNSKFGTLSSETTALVINCQRTECADLAPQTYFSDIWAIQLYRIAFLLLKFMCLQAEGAAKRAEERGFVDIAQFPELPMPDILHGLQDQGIKIVTELCEAKKIKPVSSEMQGVCILLLQITTMSLYLEMCVSQICGIIPVLGRIEDFLKELKLFIRATEGHAFLKQSVKSLKQIASFVYPGLLKDEGFL